MHIFPLEVRITNHIFYLVKQNILYQMVNNNINGNVLLNAREVVGFQYVLLPCVPASLLRLSRWKTFDSTVHLLGFLDMNTGRELSLSKTKDKSSETCTSTS